MVSKLRCQHQNVKKLHFSIDKITKMKYYNNTKALEIKRKNMGVKIIIIFNLFCFGGDFMI